MVKQILMTKEGILKLEAELEYLRDVRRLEVIEKLRKAGIRMEEAREKRKAGGIFEGKTFVVNADVGHTTSARLLVREGQPG